jgi:hypothetical protein
MAAYTLHFSDPTKTAIISVPGTDTGPGKNNYDTTLELVGSGYPNYGNAIAQNFVHLLENFASPYPPNNAIEGQLWYDTSNPNKKVLRINNGTVTGTRWQTASGIYQQPNDPSNEYASVVAEGDMWIDTSASQVKIRYGTGWTVVGPNATSGLTKTGSEAVFLESNTGTTYPVILNWSNGKVIEIISYNDFTPRTVIEGFFSIKPGTNLTNKVSAKYNGTSDRASSLITNNGVIIPAYEVLTNRASVQTHTGTFVVESGNGFYVTNPSFSRFINIYNTSTGGFINYSDTNSSFRVGVQSNSYIRFNGTHRNIGINTSTTSISPTLDVNGGGGFAGTVTIAIATSTNIGLALTGSMSVVGGIYINPISVSGTFTNVGIINNGQTISRGRIIVGSSPSGSGVALQPATNNTYDIGTTATSFRAIYASRIGTTGTNVDIYGTVYGTTTRLQTARNFKIQGQITATSVSFNGTSDAVFTTTLTRSVITEQITTNTTTATQTLLVLNTSTSTTTLESISKATFLSDVYPGLVRTGMIIPYAGTVSPDTSTWLVANGAEVSKVAYINLFAVCGTTFGTPADPLKFTLPNMTSSTQAWYNLGLTYLIKT